jgi:hypothetical protein
MIEDEGRDLSVEGVPRGESKAESVFSEYDK